MNVATEQQLLIIARDPKLRQQMETSLRPAGLATAAAASGREALLLEATAPPALILLDLQLEDMAGREFLQCQDQLGRRTPFILLAGQGDTRAAVEMMKQGALEIGRASCRERV